MSGVAGILGVATSVLISFVDVRTGCVIVQSLRAALMPSSPAHFHHAASSLN
jgi:hypothetical protein